MVHEDTPVDNIPVAKARAASNPAKSRFSCSKSRFSWSVALAFILISTSRVSTSRFSASTVSAVRGSITSRPMPLTPTGTEAASVAEGTAGSTADGTADSIADVLGVASGATTEAPLGTATPALSIEAALLVDASWEAPLSAVMRLDTSASPPNEIYEGEC